MTILHTSDNFIIEQISVNDLPPEQQHLFEAPKIHDWIQLYSGDQFFPEKINKLIVNIEDIAHSLSMTCRFSGHCEHFYSVAEHSVLCSYFVDPQYALEALLHDGSEAYLVDVPTPIKNMLPVYKEWEAKVELVIAKTFGLPFPMSPEVKRVDRAILISEYQHMMKKTHQWHLEGEGLEINSFFYWSPSEAKSQFLNRFYELMGA